MQAKRGVLCGLALTGAFGAALCGWSQWKPASAQVQTETSTSRNGTASASAYASSSGGQRGGAGGFGGGFSGSMLGGGAIAANADFVYVLRGNTVYQFHANDMSLVNKQELPQDEHHGAVGGFNGGAGGAAGGAGGFSGSVPRR